MYTVYSTRAKPKCCVTGYAWVHHAPYSLLSNYRELCTLYRQTTGHSGLLLLKHGHIIAIAIPDLKYYDNDFINSVSAHEHHNYDDPGQL